MCEQLGYANFGTQLLTQARGNTYRQQRVSAKRKEIVVTTNRLQPQQVTPDRGNKLFDFPLRCFIRMRRIGRIIRCRQGLAIQLAIGGQRQAIQLHIGGWNHVIRQ